MGSVFVRMLQNSIHTIWITSPSTGMAQGGDPCSGHWLINYLPACFFILIFIFILIQFTLYFSSQFQGSRVNYGNNEPQNSPLHLAAIKGNTEVCSLLLKLGAKRYVVNRFDRTAAQMAVDNGMYAYWRDIIGTNYTVADCCVFICQCVYVYT